MNDKFFFIFFLLGTLQVILARIGFKKDQSMDKIDFPPRFSRQVEGVPTGHLRPLGWQRRPDGKVFEKSNVPSPEEFYTGYVKNKKPVVLRKAMENVPAMTTWQKDETLKKNYGELSVHVVVKKELFERGPKRMKLRKFLKEYQYEDWYLSNIVPQEMMAELVLPQCLSCGIGRHLVESEIWMSSGGTASLLHSHADHNLHCVLAGRKDFILIDPKYSNKVAYIEKKSSPGAGYSEIDMDMVNVFKYKDVSSVPWTWSTLRAGDCIFVPATYLHQVRSYGRSFSSTTLWSPQPKVTFDDCKDIDIGAVIPLSQANFMWTYTKADRQLTNVHLNAPSMRHHLLLLMREEKALVYSTFREFYLEVMSEVDDHKPVRDVWFMMDGERKMSLPRSELLDLDTQVLHQVAEAINYAHSPPTLHDEL